MVDVGREEASVRVRSDHGWDALYGTKGTVVGFAFRGGLPSKTHPSASEVARTPNYQLPIVFVQLDACYTGPSVDRTRPRVVPIVGVASDANIHKCGGKYNRVMLPIRVAHASTVHSEQGATEHDGVVVFPSEKAPFASGLEYVAISRPTCIVDDDGQRKLMLVSPLRSDHFTSHQETKALVEAEYERLRALNDEPPRAAATEGGRAQQGLALDDEATDDDSEQAEDDDEAFDDQMEDDE